MVVVTHVILDLDGTLIDSEDLVDRAVRKILKEKHFREYGDEVAALGRGKRPLEACAAVVQALDLACSAEELFEQTEAVLTGRWGEVKLLPGALRLLRHLRAEGVPMALATSSPRATVDKKLAGYGEVRAMFSAAVYGDEVANGKPAPDLFVEAAKRMGVEPEQCLVLEDAPSGVEAAAAAGMHVFVVPSLRNKALYPTPPLATFDSCLLDFAPPLYGLAPFTDWTAGALPLDEIWRMKGPVVKGFGRGSKELGIPTANLPNDVVRETIGAATAGIYVGWASVGSSDTVYKAVMSIGWNPFYNNKEKTAEPWLLHEFPEDFYDDELRLVVCGYVRPEANFESLDALILRIHADADVARASLPLDPFNAFGEDPFLRPAA